MKGQYFSLPPARKAQIEALADAKCYKCRGTGLGKWKNGGARVELCKCVKTNLPVVQKELEAKQAALTAQLKKKAARKRAAIIGGLALALTTLLAVAFFVGTRYAVTP